MNDDILIFDESRTVLKGVRDISITSVVIPDGVTTIWKSAFCICSSLSSINIPNSVTSIGEYAFGNCRNLTSIKIPNSVTKIGDGAFYGCSGLISLVVDKENSVFDSRNNCNAIINTTTNSLIFGCKKSTIPQSVTSIGNYAFDGCSSLTSIDIPNSVTSIGERAFSGCSGLTSIDIPNSVTSIGDGAFAGCSSLTAINIPDSVTSIGERAFEQCSGLTSIDIPDSVTYIGWSTFEDCSNLNSINIPNSVTKIYRRAFHGCSSLTSISIPNSVTSIGNFVFLKLDMEFSIKRIEAKISKDEFGNWQNLPAYVATCEPKTMAQIHQILEQRFTERFTSYESISETVVQLKNAPIEENFNLITKALNV